MIKLNIDIAFLPWYYIGYKGGVLMEYTIPEIIAEIEAGLKRINISEQTIARARKHLSEKDIETLLRGNEEAIAKNRQVIEWLKELDSYKNAEK